MNYSVSFPFLYCCPFACLYLFENVSVFSRLSTRRVYLCVCMSDHLHLVIFALVCIFFANQNPNACRSVGNVSCRIFLVMLFDIVTHYTYTIFFTGTLRLTIFNSIESRLRMCVCVISLLLLFKIPD